MCRCRSLRSLSSLPEPLCVSGEYGIDIGDTERLKELAYHCFLCGRCTEVCPKGIDGRQVILNMRQKAVRENGGRVPEKGYGMLLWEKRIIGSAMKRIIEGKKYTLSGCNFPSFFRKPPGIWRRSLPGRRGWEFFSIVVENR